MAEDRCNVVDYGCLAPTNGITRVRSRCFRCGDTVCTNCSEVQPYLRHGRKRICNNCREELIREAARLGHRCPTVIFPLGGDTGTCVDCGKKWTRTELSKRRS
jgi:hypothetical protein